HTLVWCGCPRRGADVRCGVRVRYSRTSSGRSWRTMCGIVGISAQRDVAGDLIRGLKALEYRGYDSAGIAMITATGLQRLRTHGKVQQLERLQQDTPLSGHAGIAHTRWATHGAPNTDNAHPHLSGETLSVVHNGIIENHA